MAAVEVDELTIRYGDLVAVDRLCFVAEAGRVTALLGPNGAGKTSTVEAVEGYRRPHGGRVRVLGLDPVADHRAVVGRVGVMLQEGGVATGIRPLEVLRLFAAFYDDPDDPVALLDRVGLTDRARTPWRHLSGGERQRLSLALALVGRPEVAVLDEPTAGVDPAGRQVVRGLVDELRRGGVAVLLTTHDLAEAERLADHVVIVDGGRLLAQGSPAELTRALAGGGPGGGVRFEAPPGLDVAALGAAAGREVVEVEPGRYLVGGEGGAAVVAAVSAWLAERDVPVHDLTLGRQRLEDVFLRLVAEADSTMSAPGTTRRAMRGQARQVRPGREGQR